MKLRELNEAYKDKTHPRHDEAVKELEKLAKTLTPRMSESTLTAIGIISQRITHEALK
ncbi:hypothetical protein ACN082_10215 [Rothia sp. CCM 9417]|uniref:hypothetical protein n=1 Tax=Rothia sp. CCM 9417 TaxID=3402657 RepID=UPI003AE88EAC